MSIHKKNGDHPRNIFTRLKSSHHTYLLLIIHEVYLKINWALKFTVENVFRIIITYYQSSGGIVPTKVFSTGNGVLFPNPSPFLTIKKFIKVSTGVSICLTSYFFSSSPPPPVHIWRVFSYKISDSAPASRPKLLWNTTTLGYICWHVFLTWSRKRLCPFLSIYIYKPRGYLHVHLYLTHFIA